MKRSILLFSILALMAISCDRTPVITIDPNAKDPYKENMINANKIISQSEDTKISSYIERRGWDMKQLPNGEYLQEVEKGKGGAIDFEDTISVSYSVSFLTGTTVYPHEEETFVVGQHKPTVGLDRAVLELHHGSKARLILPSSLGYGVVGDGDKIPGRAVLVYELEVL